MMVRGMKISGIGGEFSIMKTKVYLLEKYLSYEVFEKTMNML